MATVSCPACPNTRVWPRSPMAADVTPAAPILTSATDLGECGSAPFTARHLTRGRAPGALRRHRGGVSLWGPLEPCCSSRSAGAPPRSERRSSVEQVVAVAAQHFGSGFGAVMAALLKKHVRPGQRVVECLTKVAGSDEPRLEAMLELLASPPAPAALVGIATRPTPEIVAAFRARAIPVVLIDEEAAGATTVACDNRIGGLLAGQHLLRSRRRNPAVVCGRRGVAGGHNAITRVKGFEEALAAAHLTLRPENVLEVVDYTRKDGVTSMMELLGRTPAVDAVFCAAGD